MHHHYKWYQSIRFKLIKNMLIVLGVVVLMGSGLIYVNSKNHEKINDMFKITLLLNNIQETLDETDKQLVFYLSSKSSDSLNSYMMAINRLHTFKPKILNEIRYYDEEELMLIDIENMLRAYISKTEEVVTSKRKNNVGTYTQLYNEALTIKYHIEGYIYELGQRQLNGNAKSYLVYNNMVGFLWKLNLGLLLLLVGMGSIFILRSTNHMVKPIIHLSYIADNIANGDFIAEDITVKTNDEVEVLADAFNRMKKSIYNHIEALRAKAQTEAELKDQQMENYRIQQKLDQAQLYYLQAQMNPHFLFNTVNAAVQLATMEEAYNTRQFLEVMSRLYRYNIKELEKAVTLKQEIHHVQDYFQLLKVRYGDQIQLKLDIDESATQVLMPPLILQPLVENAYFHGLTDMESGGIISIEVIDRYIEVLLIVRDNGKGMSKEQVQKAMTHEKTHQTKSTGIGMKNVFERLEIFYGENNLIHINSKENMGTEISIRLCYK